jgi:hypothetical protein
MSNPPKQDAVTPEEFRMTMELASRPRTSMPLGKLENLVSQWRAEWSDRRLPPLQSIADIKPDPSRVARIMQMESLVTRRPMLFDKATGEVIEIGMRSIRLLNRLSMMSVESFRASREAEDWVRAQTSGRKMKADGTIVYREACSNRDRADGNIA